MHFRFHTGAVIGFFVLFLLLHELHELAHHGMVRLLCGCWGVRDFLIWRTCDGCHDTNTLIIAGFAGPLITYCIIWAGFFLLRSTNHLHTRTIGFALIMGALPLPRLLGAADRGGDEINTMRLVMEGQEPFKGAPVVVGGLIILLLIVPPLWRAFRTIEKRQRLFVFISFLVIPWLLDLLIITKGLNGSLLPGGFLGEPVYFGTPLLIIVWEVLLLVGFVVTFRKIRYLTSSSDSVTRHRGDQL